MALIEIKKFEDLLADFNSRLEDYGSQITNRQEGGAFDLLIRVECLQVSDAYSLVENEIPNLFPVTAAGSWLDLHGESIGLPREQPSKCLKEFVLTRDSDSGYLNIPVGDVIKTPVLPSRGQVRFVAIATEEVDLSVSAEAVGANLVSDTVNFVEEGVKVGSWLFNDTDGSYGKITVVEEHQLTAVMTGGTNNSFEIGDACRTLKPSEYAGQFLSRSSYATTGSTGETLYSTYDDFLNIKELKRGMVAYNITDGSEGVITEIYHDRIVCALSGGSNNEWTVGDEYKLQPDLKITIRTEARFEGTEANNAETILGRDGQAVECEADSGFTGVDHIFTTGEDLQAGTDLELDADFRNRILNRWKELARGSTKEAYKNFARTSSTAVFDANVYKGDGPTDVKIILSGVPGSRDLNEAIGIKVDPIDNYNPLYTDDGTLTGLPRPLGIAVHEYIRSRAPLTDIIFLESVSEQAFDVSVKIKIIEGFDFDNVKLELLKRFRALFLVEKTVKDVTTISVGETLLFSRLTKLVSGTPGVADFNFYTPDPGTNFGDTAIDPDKVFSLGTINIEEL